MSEVVLIDGTPAFIKHHHIPDLEAEGYRKKHLEESPNLRMKDLSEKIRAYCDVNDIKLENTDIFYIARNDDFYSEENISIHTLENWEVVVDDEVEK